MLGLSLALSAVLTAAAVVSGADWAWAVFCNRHPALVWASVPAVAAGMFVPIAIPAWFYHRYRRYGDDEAGEAAALSARAFVASYALMTALKVVTNREDMEPFEPIGDVDRSGAFRFGWMRGDSWWESFAEGWPSGHTLIAVCMAIVLHPWLRSATARRWNLAWPVIVGLSVSTAFHWASDVASGALLGAALGLALRRAR